MNVYLDLTREYNVGALRAVLSSGQAVVLHRLAIMSKDGDWILREAPTALEHVRGVLATRKARYRFGAPLDLRWMEGGWSSHLEFKEGGLRVRTDFVTRPARITPEDLDDLWKEQEGSPLPFVDVRRLVEIKKTNREKDYVIIGELARLIADPREQLLTSRSARDLIRISEDHPVLTRDLVAERPALSTVDSGIEALEVALDAERRQLIRVNEQRLATYAASAEAWSLKWPQVRREIAGMQLAEAHEFVVDRALGVLPFSPEEDYRP
jgi:hypothetical protein